jgi:hypothetical protein
VAYNAVRMEPVFMALGQVAGIAAHLAIQDVVPVRRVPTGKLQQLLVERGGVVTFYDDLNFDDPDFAAFQWLGARALNPGYKATPDIKLTRRDGWTKLKRILEAEGRPWTEPQENPTLPLRGDELAQWLRQAGYQPEVGRFAALKTQSVVLKQFANLVYQTLIHP